MQLRALFFLSMIKYSLNLYLTQQCIKPHILIFHSLEYSLNLYIYKINKKENKKTSLMFFFYFFF